MTESEMYRVAGEILSGSCVDGLAPYKVQQIAARIVSALEQAESGRPAPNKQSTPRTWKCACGQDVVGDYCRCGAYRCDL